MVTFAAVAGVAVAVVVITFAGALQLLFLLFCSCCVAVAGVVVADDIVVVTVVVVACCCHLHSVGCGHLCCGCSCWLPWWLVVGLLSSGHNDDGK